jgi:hypothetical protein
MYTINNKLNNGFLPFYVYSKLKSRNYYYANYRLSLNKDLTYSVYVFNTTVSCFHKRLAKSKSHDFALR